MKEVCADLLAEYEALADLAETLTPQQWAAKTQFYGWTPWDEIAHLHFFDGTGLLAATDPQAFARDTAAMQAERAGGKEISVLTRERLGALSGPALVALWRERFRRLVAALAAHGPRDRLPWYGPTMSARSFATARLMETWAHGQDVYDLARRRRPPSARLRHIAHIGVTTFGWSFVNRGLPAPAQRPWIELRAPDGATWTWGEPSAAGESLRGSAEDFCLVVTQRRHPSDTDLEISGEGTRAWMAIAQCFAGPPADGPAPGVRKVVY